METLSPGIKRPECEADSLHQPSDEFKHVWLGAITTLAVG